MVPIFDLFGVYGKKKISFGKFQSSVCLSVVRRHYTFFFVKKPYFSQNKKTIESPIWTKIFCMMLRQSHKTYYLQWTHWSTPIAEGTQKPYRNCVVSEPPPPQTHFKVFRRVWVVWVWVGRFEGKKWWEVLPCKSRKPRENFRSEKSFQKVVWVWGGVQTLHNYGKLTNKKNVKCSYLIPSSKSLFLFLSLRPRGASDNRRSVRI